jgi:hypothetical protein
VSEVIKNPPQGVDEGASFEDRHRPQIPARVLRHGHGQHEAVNSHCRQFAPQQVDCFARPPPRDDLLLVRTFEGIKEVNLPTRLVQLFTSSELIPALADERRSPKSTNRPPGIRWGAPAASGRTPASRRTPNKP